MNRLLELPSVLKDEIEQAYRGSLGKWDGCNWRTEFGKGRLNLMGMTSTQAMLMARATAGSEAENWRAAAGWLIRVEQAVQDAEAEARCAALLARSGKLTEAIRHARRACMIEGTYHTQLVWAPLRNAIEVALAESNQPGDNVHN